MATTTEKDETTVTMISDGKPGVEMTMTEFEDTTREALDRVGRRQLSFDVGGQEPNRSSVKATVDLIIPRELLKGSQVLVSVTTKGGELLGQCHGKVIGVHFDDVYDKDGILAGTERVHKVKLAI